MLIKRMAVGEFKTKEEAESYLMSSGYMKNSPRANSYQEGDHWVAEFLWGDYWYCCGTQQTFRKCFICGKEIILKNHKISKV